MEIRTIQNQSRPAFKAVNIVRMPKTAFKEPFNRSANEREFARTLEKITGDPLKGVVGSLLALLGLRKLAKTAVISELPSYAYTTEQMKKEKVGYSLDWVRMNTGLPIKDSINTDTTQTFYVLTKEHKNMLAKTIASPLKNTVKYIKDAVNKYPSASDLLGVYFAARLGCDIDKNFESIIADEPITEFYINSLDEIPNIVKDLDV